MWKAVKIVIIAALVLYVINQPDVAAQQTSDLINWVLDALGSFGRFVSGINMDA